MTHVSMVVSHGLVDALAESWNHLGLAATQAWMLKDGDCARSPQDQLMFALLS